MAMASSLLCDSIYCSSLGLLPVALTTGIWIRVDTGASRGRRAVHVVHQPPTATLQDHKSNCRRVSGPRGRAVCDSRMDKGELHEDTADGTCCMRRSNRLLAGGECTSRHRGECRAARSGGSHLSERSTPDSAS